MRLRPFIIRTITFLSSHLKPLRQIALNCTESIHGRFPFDSIGRKTMDAIEYYFFLSAEKSSPLKLDLWNIIAHVDRLTTDDRRRVHSNGKSSHDLFARWAKRPFKCTNIWLETSMGNLYNAKQQSYPLLAKHLIVDSDWSRCQVCNTGSAFLTFNLWCPIFII